MDHAGPRRDPRPSRRAAVHGPGDLALRPPVHRLRPPLRRVDGPLVAVVFGVTVARLWLAADVSLGDDEAYYWLWSTRPDWSYFDHPPMVAWLIAASTAAFGDTPAAVRLPFAALGALLPLQAAGLAQAAGRPPRLTALIVLWAPMFALLSVFASPDMPLLCALLLTLRLRWWARAVAARWAVVGAAWGVALLCKLPAVLLAPLLLLWAAEAGWLGALALLLAATVVSAPVWGWSLAHDHAMLRFHVVGRHVQPLGALGGLAAFLGGALLLSGAAAAGLGRALRRRTPLDLLAIGWIGLFSVSALGTRALPHWAAPAMLLLAPAAASTLTARPRWRTLLLSLGAALGALVMVQARWSPLPLPLTADPTAEQRGWPQVAARLRAELTTLPLGSFVATTRYQIAAQVAWALGATQPLTRLGGRPDQLDIWRADGALRGRSAVLLCSRQYPCAPSGNDWAGGCHPLPDERVLGQDGGELRVFKLWRCEGFRGAGGD